MRTGPQFNPERNFTKVIGTAGDGCGFDLSGDWWGALYLKNLTPRFNFCGTITNFLENSAAESYFFYTCSDICRSFLVKSFCFVSFTLIEKCANANTRKSPQEPSTVQMTTVPPAGG